MMLPQSPQNEQWVELPVLSKHEQKLIVVDRARFHHALRDWRLEIGKRVSAVAP